MVKPKENDPGSVIVQVELAGGGEILSKVQKALLLGIEVVGSHNDQSGDEDHQEAVWMLSMLLREFMLDESQVNVALGGKPYAGNSKKAE
ncbi:MAG: hypothetical protein KF775_14145 [Cyclobacteriaceae bacterium]|nr:hypothetical protein [Cyclobacteriaceae bacterium]